jgi:RNA polymerase sigma factor (sigma-70 family)
MAECAPPERTPPLSLLVLGHEREQPTASLGGSNTDGDTIRRLNSADSEPYPDWESIYLDNVKRLYSLMYSRVGNRADAEDLTSEIFMAALRPLRTTASKPEVRAYLVATARTTLAAYWRRKLGVEVTSIDIDSAIQFIDETPPDNVPTDRADQVLSLLPDRYRRILELRFIQSMPLREAANEMGITVGNAKVLQHRALRHAARVAKDVVP